MYQNLLMSLFNKTNYTVLLCASLYSDYELSCIEFILKSKNIHFKYIIPRLIIDNKIKKHDIIKANRKYFNSVKKYIRKGNYFPVQNLLILQDDKLKALNLLSVNGIKGFSN